MGQEDLEQKTREFFYEADPTDVYPVPEGETRVHADIVRLNGQITFVVLIGSHGSILPTLDALSGEISIGYQENLVAGFNTFLLECIEEVRREDNTERGVQSS